ncbi:hypothetical protein BLNAU_17345 [Blattamonas nauphoetae]|uniref:Uncharacterized protein n=1 Tax=Blattamonas nauphoetae TaxID=2049346 RepID=A0ABQ9X979_9EUKA|nr:hypothetical protein BLNAU_17345 [Blattamonas nauphoetae]
MRLFPKHPHPHQLWGLFENPKKKERTFRAPDSVLQHILQRPEYPQFARIAAIALCLPIDDHLVIKLLSPTTLPEDDVQYLVADWTRTPRQIRHRESDNDDHVLSSIPQEDHAFLFPTDVSFTYSSDEEINGLHFTF